jgi:two-component system cell cycle sensor histidine kinase/response regulator CckA
MNKPLRVLQIEDSESDAAFVLRVLENSGYTVTAQRVEDAGQLRAALDGGPWDIVVADYSLPQFDAAAALRIMRESGADVPLIVVSGSIGEERAVEMMRLGANDYVMKDKLARLVPAVERELREARTRQQRRVAEAGLRASQEGLALAIDATQLGTFDYQFETSQLSWSDFAKRQFGASPGSETPYTGALAAIHPADRDRVIETIRAAKDPASGGVFAAEFRTVGIEDKLERCLSAFGRVFFSGNGRPERFLGVTLDTTERKQLEDQFRQAQKLESIGRLAGGVAHDFNNLLTVIMGYAQMTLAELGMQHPLRDAVEEIAKASGRAADLTRQLLTFSRRQISEPKKISINELVRNFEKMLHRLIGEDVELVLALDQYAGVIEGDPGQIEQILMNLAVNAKDAMPSGGRLLIETTALVVDEQFAKVRLSMETGSYVVLAVTDSGAGMTREVQSKIFEPFFTTKEAGRGTGLGLSTVYGIVKNSNGSIWVQSEPGKGTTFKMLFPAVPDAILPDAGRLLQSAIPKGMETVLIAEDETAVRKYVRQILELHGYSVLEASNGRDALDVISRHTGDIHLLLADVVMPEMGGPELAVEFAALRPGKPVLCMSGYSSRPWPYPQVPVHHIQKPFTPAALLTHIRALLDK